MKKYLLLLPFLAASGCCTKMNCISTPHDMLHVILEHFSDTDLAEGRTYIYDRQNNALLDSAYYDFSADQHWGLTYYLNGGVYKIDQLYFVIKAGGRQYTVRDVTYDTYEYKTKCNKCFLADGSETLTDFRTTSFTFNGQPYTGTDSLVIQK